MKEKLNFYEIDMKYVRNLSKVDDNVMSVSPQLNKENRPFVGIIVLVNKKKYCVPLSSPKPKYQNKKNSIDFVRIIDESTTNNNSIGKIIGALNFNNMLPVEDSVLKRIDIRVKSSDGNKERVYKNLLSKQLDWCQKNEEKIVSHANRTYDMITKYPEKSRDLVRRCCDFKKLENVLEKYLGKKEPKLQIQSDTMQHNKKNERILYNNEKGRKAAQQIRKDSINDLNNKGKNNPVL